MKRLLLIALLLSGCGGSDSKDSPTPVSKCITCFTSIHPLNPDMAPGMYAVWQTTDGTYIDECNASSAAYSCDSGLYNCAATTFTISTAEFWCQ